MKKDVVFIILHYQSIEDTERCIESIKSLDEWDRTGIILIDNASPNGSGARLYKEYSQDESIEIIMNDTNVGFSHANNQGFYAAKQKWNPDFYVVANNDIIFEQRDFIQRIFEKYDKYHYYILGPDIYSTRQNIHQSPIDKSFPSKRRTLRTIVLNYLSLKLFWILYPLLRLWYKKVHNNNRSRIGFDVEQKNVCLQGACLVFSKVYTDERNIIYSPETFFYAEEAIYTLWCSKNNKLTLYTPDIRVLHNESSSTLSEHNVSERIKFQMYNILNATIIYYGELRKYNE